MALLSAGLRGLPVVVSLDPENLEGPEFFTCERFKARMLKKRCIEMQAKLLQSKRRFSTGGEAVSLAALDHGFENEKEMFTWLLKEWSLKAVGDLLGCSGATVRKKRNEYGIPARKVGANGRRIKMKATQTEKKADVVVQPIGPERSSKQEAAESSKLKAESEEMENKVIRLDFRRYPFLWEKLEKAAARRGLNPDITVMMLTVETLMAEDW